ncbi:F-box/LRR-repeat protein 4-like [Temnothorax longispinosus]|uniref:F-box/LRR-repeat protein 4-like n=1 Tax=Temnothorax longispinosus TaxID=300112 RepID=UPI003A98EE7C
MASYHSIKVVAGEDRVNFIYQFVKDSDSCIKEYNYRNTWSISKTSKKIIGPPTNFPNYGDFSGSLVMRTNGFDISTSPWQKPITSSYDNPPQDVSHMYCNYLHLEFHKAVYPVRVSIYEVYNPGYVTEIWARGCDQRKNQWFLLWSGSPQTAIPLTSRIFSPPLKFCDFKINELKLQFMYSHWDYSTHLDAVKLIGTSELVLPKSPELNLTNLLKTIQQRVLTRASSGTSKCHRK